MTIAARSSCLTSRKRQAPTGSLPLETRTSTTGNPSGPRADSALASRPWAAESLLRADKTGWNVDEGASTSIGVSARRGGNAAPGAPLTQTSEPPARWITSLRRTATSPRSAEAAAPERGSPLAGRLVDSFADRLHAPSTSKFKRAKAKQAVRMGTELIERPRGFRTGVGSGVGLSLSAATNFVAGGLEPLEITWVGLPWGSPSKLALFSCGF